MPLDKQDLVLKQQLRDPVPLISRLHYGIIRLITPEGRRIQIYAFAIQIWIF